MKLLINGGCGFLGSNLASYGIEHGYDVTVLDNLSRYGSAENLAWLRGLGNIEFINADIRNANDVDQVISKGGFNAVFHLAGQVAMTTSLADPRRDFETNALGTFNVLDSVRKHAPETIVFYSSTNKVYGDLEQFEYRETSTRYECIEYPNGFDESIPLDFRSPYGCSKGSADQYMLDFGRMYGLRTAVFRHSSMYGSRQFATYDQGWIGWFVRQAIEKAKNPIREPFTISGNGKQVRDVLHAEDMISLYFSALENADTVCGEAYNIGGTMEQSLSLLELFAILEDMLGIDLEYKKLPPRQSDQKVFVADVGKIEGKIGWQPRITVEQGLSAMIDWVGRR